MGSTEVWPGRGPSDQIYGVPMLQHDNILDPQEENWEDWLRWDPTAEAASPEDGTMHSGSSKNDSPIQDPVLPVPSEVYGKGGLIDETLAPPLIMGDEGMDFSTAGIGNMQDVPFLFGDNAAIPTFEFGATATSFQQPVLHSVPRIETNLASWPQVPTDASHNVSLSAISNDNANTFPSAAPTASSSPTWQQSPMSTSQPRTSISMNNSNSNSPIQEKPAPKKRGGRKRKADVQQEEEQKEDKEENGESLGEDGEPPVKKTSHNVIERRYRTNLNDKIVELRNAVPALRAVKRNKNDQTAEDLEGLKPAHKLNKATVMGKATEYIRHLEKRTKSMTEEIANLKARLAAFEAGSATSPDSQGSFSHSSPSDGFRSSQPSSASQTFLSVPQEQTRFGQQFSPQQQHDFGQTSNPPAEAQNQGQNRGRNGVMNKVMMGAMAGLMVMEGLSEQQDDTRMLFAVPTTLFRRGLDMTSPTSISELSKAATIPILKLFLVVGTLLYLIQPLLAFSTPRKQKTSPTVRLPAVPSLASPVEVRRKAWLTAVQTVYVPKHFLLEVVVVTAKMMMLSMRRLIGSEAYCSLMGTTKEGEAARIKAWDIAIDAQLAGGDAEVSYYRLLLTLMTSGTLPDSPIRLMQKAVHFRVFFWEMANAGYGNIIGFKQFTERVGEIYWESARKLQKELLHARAQGRPGDDSVELLPDHLAGLIELPCEEVLVDEMIQRAWNLAWNKPSAHGIEPNAAKDAVVEDHSIRSPLDAVAAWYANMLLDDTLKDTLGYEPSSWDAEYYVGTAVSIAPPGSATQGRALAAKAILSNMNREGNIIAALDALPASAPDSSTMNFVSPKPATQDVCTALTLAKLSALLLPSASDRAHQRAYKALANLHLPPGSFSLLSAVAAYRLLKVTSNSRISGPAMYGLEDLAANLRVWIGTSAGSQAGLNQDACGKVVDMCLRVARKAGGWEERDSGYNSGEGSPRRTKAHVIVG